MLVPMSDDMTMDATTAGAALREADELGTRTRRAGRWYARYMLVFGGGFGLMTLLLGLGPDAGPRALWWALGLTGVWAVFVAVMVAWAFRRPVQGELKGSTYVPGWVGTSLLYALALGVGLNLDLTAWAWVVAALVVPLPLALSAVRLHRSLS